MVMKEKEKYGDFEHPKSGFIDYIKIFEAYN